MTSTLIVFVDALPYSYLANTQFLSTFPHQQKVSPGLGFSVNIKPELFAGLTPDDVGFFCEWTVKDPLQRGRESVASPVFEQIRRVPVLDRALHKAAHRLGRDVLNIPFGYLRYFTNSLSRSVYDRGFPFPTLFSQAAVGMVLADRLDRSKGDRDLQTYQLALEKMEDSESLYVSFLGLDGVGHHFGVGSPEYQATVSRLEGWIRDLVHEFDRRHRQANIVVLSDHGMASLSQSIRLNLEKHLGPATPQSYLYFVDAVMLRVWVYQPRLASDILDVLRALESGTVLDDDCRKRLGVSSRRYGDIIYVLDEGRAFSPSFFGLKLQAGMHGFLPHVESQQAVLLASGDQIDERGFGNVRRSRDVYPFLLSLLGRER